MLERLHGKSVFVERISDTRDVKGRSGGAGSQRAVPSDFLVTYNGKMFYAEVKSTHNKTSYPFADIRASQWRAALRQIAAKGEYWFFIKNCVTKKWYIVPAEIMLALREGKRKSVEWETLEDYKHDSPKIP